MLKCFKSDLWRFFAKCFGFISLFLLSDYFIFQVFLSPFIDNYRPHYSEIPEKGIHAEKQLVHIDVESRRKTSKSRSVFVGSSSVVNGIDTEIIEAIWNKHGLNREAVNYGMTAFLSYELPLLKKIILNHNNRVVVFLYNSFSFADNIHPVTIENRWNTFEILRLGGVEILPKIGLFPILRGIAGEYSFVIRNIELLHYLISRYLNYGLSPSKTDFEFSVSEATPPTRNRVYEKVAPDTDVVRDHFLTSDTDKDTLGYRGLERFAQLAKKNNIQLIILPMPEPKFSNYGKYRQGINVARIDGRIQCFCEKHDIPYISRAEISEFEENDQLFRDEMHLHSQGRKLYTAWLAERISKIENK